MGVAVAPQNGDMHKNIGAAIVRLDEAIALDDVKPFDFAAHLDEALRSISCAGLGSRQGAEIVVERLFVQSGAFPNRFRQPASRRR